MTTVTAPAVVPGTPAPIASKQSPSSSWLDPIIDHLNAQAFDVWEGKLNDLQAWLNDGNAGWFAQASAAVAAGKPLPAVPALPVMTWTYNDGTGGPYQQQTITPQAALTVPAIHAPSSNPNPGEIAAENPTTAADTQQSELQYLVATVAKIAKAMGVS